MGDTPTANNQIAEFLDQFINALVTGGEVAAEAYITSLDPALLAVPIIKWFVDQGVQYLGKLLSVATQKVITGLVIDIQTNGEESAVLTSATALALAQGSGDPAAVQNAVNDAIKAWGELIHWDGSAQPIP